MAQIEDVSMLEEWAVRALPDDESEARATIGGVTLSVRRLARKGGMARSVTQESRVLPSGGFEVAVRIPPCAYDPQPVYKSSRMGPGWTAGDLKRRVRYLVTNARAQMALRIARDGLWSLIRMEEDMTALDEAMVAEEAVSGHASVLDDMTEDDVRFWWQWISAWRGIRTLAS